MSYDSNTTHEGAGKMAALVRSSSSGLRIADVPDDILVDESSRSPVSNGLRVEACSSDSLEGDAAQPDRTSYASKKRARQQFSKPAPSPHASSSSNASSSWVRPTTATPTAKKQKTAPKSSPPASTQPRTFEAFFRTLPKPSAVFKPTEEQKRILCEVSGSEIFEKLEIRDVSGVDSGARISEQEELSREALAWHIIHWHRFPRGLDFDLDAFYALEDLEHKKRASRMAAAQGYPHTFFHHTEIFRESPVFGSKAKPWYERVIYSHKFGLLVPLKTLKKLKVADLKVYHSRSTLLTEDINGRTKIQDKLWNYPILDNEVYPVARKILETSFYLLKSVVPFLDVKSRFELARVSPKFYSLTKDFYPMNQLAYGGGVTKGLYASRIIRNDLVLLTDVIHRGRPDSFDVKLPQLDTDEGRKVDIVGPAFSAVVKGLAAECSVTDYLPNWRRVLLLARFETASFLGIYRNPYKSWARDEKDGYTPFKTFKAAMLWHYKFLRRHFTESGGGDALWAPIEINPEQQAAIFRPVSFQLVEGTNNCLTAVTGAKCLYASFEYSPEQKKQYKKYLLLADTEGNVARISPSDTHRINSNDFHLLLQRSFSLVSAFIRVCTVSVGAELTMYADDKASVEKYAPLLLEFAAAVHKRSEKTAEKTETKKKKKK